MLLSCTSLVQLCSSSTHLHGKQSYRCFSWNTTLMKPLLSKHTPEACVHQFSMALVACCKDASSSILCKVEPRVRFHSQVKIPAWTSLTSPASLSCNRRDRVFLGSVPKRMVGSPNIWHVMGEDRIPALLPKQQFCCNIRKVETGIGQTEP